MSSILNNDNFVSVLPRIIDPGMQFTKESILNSHTKNASENTFTDAKSAGSAIPVNSVDLEKKESMDNSQVQKSSSFFSDYKYIIFMVIISIVIIIIVYFIYKYFDNKNNPKKIEADPNKEETKLLDSGVSTNAIDKDIKDYISNYIIDENDDEEEEKDDTNVDNDDDKEEKYDDEKKNNIVGSKEPHFNPIIQKPTPVVNTELLLDSNVSTIILDSNLDLNNRNLESDNIDFLLNSLNKKDTIDYDNYNGDIDDSDVNGDNDSDSSIPIFGELEEEQEYENYETKELKNSDSDDVNVDDDDLKYFKKFAKK